MKILILCTGNSCRSQMAEGFLKSIDSNLYVRSAGTSPAHAVNAGAIRTMNKVGIDISKGTPQDVAMYLKEPWDYVITVCDNAHETCPSFHGDLGKYLHIGFEDPSHMEGNADFIEQQFDRVREEIRRGMEALYSTIKR